MVLKCTIGVTYERCEFRARDTGLSEKSMGLLLRIAYGGAMSSEEASTTRSMKWSDEFGKASAASTMDRAECSVVL